MNKNADEETQFLRGDIGVDGAAIEEEKDEAETEKDKAKLELTRNRTYLGREFLTWLLYRSESGDKLVEHDGEGVSVLFTGRIVLRGIAGDATELIAKGSMSPYSEIVRGAIERGLLVHSARLRVQRGEQHWAVTIDAEHLDFRSAEVPQVLSEEEDDKITERLFLAEQLSSMFESLLGEFLKMRKTPRWRKVIVPAMREWMRPTDPAEARRVS